MVESMSLGTNKAPAKGKDGDEARRQSKEEEPDKKRAKKGHSGEKSIPAHRCLLLSSLPMTTWHTVHSSAHQEHDPSCE